MQTLFNGRPLVPAPEPGKQAEDVAPQNAPVLLVELTPWHRVFFSNLVDRLFWFHRQPPLNLTAQPADFWPDVFVERRLPSAALRQSAIYHLFLVTALWGFSHTYLAHPRTLPPQSPFEHQTITYYSVSEYLPAIESPSESAPAEVERKGDPEFARQHIISTRRNTESRTQTIVSPPEIKLSQDVPLPNIVAWTPVAASVPMAAVTHSAQQLIAPAIPVPVAPAPKVMHSAAQMRFENQTAAVEPTPVVNRDSLRAPASLATKTAVVEPAPNLESARSRNSNLPLPSAVEPPPAIANLRVPGDMNVANLNVKVAEPRLPVPDQRARGSLVDGVAPHGAAIAGGASGGAVPAAPSLQGMAAGQAGGTNAAGQLIALGIHPVPVTGPLQIPQGNRSGTFAAGPQGRPGAAGTPDMKGGGTANGTTGNGTNPKEVSRGNSAAGAGGISVSPGPNSPAGNVVVAAPATSPAGTKPASRNTLLASLTRPSVADLARRTAPGSPEPKLEDQVFGVKRYYSMTLSMPNLVSATGSWIIRFAELHASEAKGELTAPVATQKVDPAYPSDLIRERVEGVVVLYAIIRADGTVGEVRVLHGIDDRLDRNARAALARWHFRPGTKNGNAVDLEAVVQIPFNSKHLPF